MTSSQSRDFPRKTYRIFDTVIASQLDLPELPACQESSPFIRVKLAEPAQFDTTGFVSRHEWRSEDGRLVCTSARRNKEYLLSFPSQASFHFQMEGIITCIPSPGTDEGLLRHLLLNQALPRYLAHTGELLLHASAVTLPNGSTVAFLGGSGFGKSTLASYCQQQQALLIDDDCILLRFSGRETRIAGGIPTVRLYPDSLHALQHDSASFAPCVNYSDKQQMRLAEGLQPEQTHALDTLFLLDEPGTARAEDTVRIERATGQDAVMAITRSAFQLDPTDHQAMARTFSHAARLLDENVPAYHLHYPRKHASLPEVLQALVDHQLG